MLKGWGVLLASKRAQETCKPRRSRASALQDPGISPLSCHDLPCRCGDEDTGPFAGSFVEKGAGHWTWVQLTTGYMARGGVYPPPPACGEQAKGLT